MRPTSQVRDRTREGREVLCEGKLGDEVPQTFFDECVYSHVAFEEYRGLQGVDDVGDIGGEGVPMVIIEGDGGTCRWGCAS